MKSKPHRIPIEALRWNASDPLAAEHEQVSKLVAQTIASGWQFYRELDLSTTAAGRMILEAGPGETARIVLALVAHAAHCDGLANQVRALSANELERINWHHSSEWDAIWPARQVSAHALRRIMRRKLPFDRRHLLALADWINSGDTKSDYHYPLSAFVKALEVQGVVNPGDKELIAALASLANGLRAEHSKEAPKLAHRIEQCLGNQAADVVDAETGKMEASQVGEPDPSTPASSGSPHILAQLKQFLGSAPKDEVGTHEIGFDHFPLRTDSPLSGEHELINVFLSEVVEKPSYYETDLSRTESGRAILRRADEERSKLLLAVAERCVNSHFVPGGGLADHRCWQSQYAVQGLFSAVLKTHSKLSRLGLFDLLLFLSAQSGYQWTTHVAEVEKLVAQIEKVAAEAPLSAGERHVLHRVRCQTVRACPFGRPPPEVVRLNQLLKDNTFLGLVPGEAWSDVVNSELARMKPARRDAWVTLLQLAATASGSRPSAKWLKTAKEHIKALGSKQFTEAVLRWFPLVNAPRTVRLLGGGPLGHSDMNGLINEDNATCLRGLVWMAPEVVSAEVIRAVGALTVSAYRKIAGVGPRAVKVGNAGVYALSQITDQDALGQLALLKVKVKFGSAQKEIEKAFNAAAERSGLPRDELEEMSVPTYGLTGVGICEELMGEFTARFTVTGTTSTELVWAKADGKIQRAVPAPVKASFKDELKELQAAAKDIQRMLPAQRERIDSLFLQQKTWPLAVWRERYLNHPLIGTLARRILWDVKTGDDTITAIWFQDRLVNLDLQPVELRDENTTVQLWHPIGKPTAEVVGWRAWLDEQQIQQPFKQAHREIYVLTDAERSTRTYSNRYAAHVLKQHQFNALCALRGWKNQLRLMVDAEYPPAVLHLPLWGLRAEFWIEGLGTDYGTDTNDSGTFLYLSTDQVRFYRVEAAQRTAHAGGGGYRPGHHGADAEPMPLTEIPPLVFSEVMRDVDMFVGVASVGNDPAWSDGGPAGRYQRYWQDYSFGELNASAKTRRDVLQKLLPKLKIADRCSFSDKFMIVRGSLRTYKIHLGSGNILMEPNDQYLCIVPRQSEVDEGGVLLPFEGDRTLSIVLSKAFLLADDSKIKDQTILNQIK